MKYIFLVNPFGNKEKLRGVYAAFSALQKNAGNDEIIVKETEYVGHAKILAVEFAKKFEDQAVIFSCGGDGTAHEIANALAHTQTAMSVVPLGTGNDFSRSVLSDSMRKEPWKIISSLGTYQVKKIDLFRVSCFAEGRKPIPAWDRYCLNITSFGLDTAVQSSAKAIVSSSKQSPIVRKSAYPVATAYSILRGWDYQAEYMFADGLSPEKITGHSKFILLAICNGSYYGGGYNPAPQATLSDGFLDVCLVEDMPLRKVVPLISKYKAGTHLDHPKIRTYRIKKGSLQVCGTQSQLHGNYDGEDFWGNIVDFEICPGALHYAFFD